jgi:caffeoyl-CoA O-methyltransferase
MADETQDRASFAPAPVRDYIHHLHAPHDAALERAFTTPERTGAPAIQVSPSEGRLLALLLQLVGARRVVEIGTLVGYSTIHMARALPDGGHLWTLEADAGHAALARENLAAAGLAGRVSLIVGPALDTLRSLEAEGPFDAVFVDADKVNYPGYGRWAARHLRPGGLLLGDNALLFGQLLDDAPPARAMRQFHEEAARSFDSVCVPTPDGLLVGIKRDTSR